MYINETIQKHSTDNKKHSKHKYTYYQNTHTLQNQHIHTHPHKGSPEGIWNTKIRNRSTYLCRTAKEVRIFYDTFFA